MFTAEQEELIQREILRLQNADEAALDALNEDSIQRRTEWYVENRESFDFLFGDPLETGYRLLLARFGITPTEAPVVERTEKRIVFHSQNFCPTLEACRRLGLDTRLVCKHLNEQATDTLVKLIDPRLTFSRNYELLRPYAPYCEEMITLEGE
ncbi:MAG TPA: hypothetical protein VN453_04465 [Feifaniaceae bacterium]|nr:hypothetical protein [Feifaniaceae bacterium]